MVRKDHTTYHDVIRRIPDLLPRTTYYRGTHTHFQEVSESAFHRRYHVAKFMVERLGMTAELRGHRGCVNCIQWNQSGE